MQLSISFGIGCSEKHDFFIATANASFINDVTQGGGGFFQLYDTQYKVKSIAFILNVTEGGKGSNLRDVIYQYPRKLTARWLTLQSGSR